MMELQVPRVGAFNSNTQARLCWCWMLLTFVGGTPISGNLPTAQADGPLAAGPLVPGKTTAALKVYGDHGASGDLEVQLFASEPMITNPTNIAVDGRGRVWLCDVVNYQGNQGKRPAGDRILVLEDEDGDGRADTSTVFYQGHDVDCAKGICILGSRVLVSCSPEVFALTDTDGDGRADKKEVLYTKTGDRQHDHSAHAFVFGPDGCLYWNMGNANAGVFDVDGNVVVDIFGRPVVNHGKPYRQGMAFRQSVAGDKFEVLAHNLRNSYELTVDAFGDVWFTDNDDDGNRGTRFCYALEGGNYGYTDELTGQGWRFDGRTGKSSSIPLRHWHQNDPGSIPNVLNNGSGSPAGVEVYEADLLPQRLRGGIVHCEPGHNVVRVYLPTAAGAGYTAESIELIDGRGDPWFRPVDAATAPDGSLMIADWYDPGVGGHRQADIERGRIYRVAPRGSAYRCGSSDLKDPAAACVALCNGNYAVRYAAWTALAAQGIAAEPALQQLAQSEDSRARARAYWLLTRLPEKSAGYLDQAAHDPDPRVRAAATRMTSHVVPSHVAAVLDQLVDDPAAQVRRSVAIALRRYHQQEFMPPLWARLAEQFDGADRWYLEALGLAAEMDWDRCLDAWLAHSGALAWRTPAGRMLIWRSRGKQTIEKLTALLADPATPRDELPMLLRAIDFNNTENRDAALISLAASSLSLPQNRRELVASEALLRLPPTSTGPQWEEVLDRLLSGMAHDKNYALLVRHFHRKDRYADLFSLAVGSMADTDEGIELLRFLVQQHFLEPMQSQLGKGDVAGAQFARMLALTAEPAALKLLMPLVNDVQADADSRREAVRAIANNQAGAERLVQLAETGQLEDSMQAALLFTLRTSPWKELRQRAARLQPDGADAVAEAKQLPVAEWLKMSGDAQRGQQLFAGKANCATCHKVGDVGKEVGPALTEIGSKLSRTGMYEAILYPSAAISHNYEAYLALTDAGMAVTGVLISETDETVTLKTDKAVIRELRRAELEAYEKIDISLMPSDLLKLVTPQEMADLVAYLSELKQKPPVQQ